MHFAIFDSYDKPTFKAEALCLASNEGWVKRLLLLYINGYYSLTLVLFACYWLRIPPFSFLTTHPLFKTKALRLASIEGWVKRLLLLY